MKMLEFPELKQYSDYDCGATAIQEILSYYGIDLREDFILKDAKTTKENGTPIKGIKKIFKAHKLKCVAKEMTIKELVNYIDNDVPIILLVQAWWNKKNVDWKKTYNCGHYVIAIGYDSKRIYFEDPYKLERTFLSNEKLLERWHGLSDDNKKLNHFAIAAIGIKKDGYKKIVPMN